MLRRASLLAAAVGALALAPAGSASAASCYLDDPVPTAGSLSLYDSQGFEWDTPPAPTSDVSVLTEGAMGTLYDGGKQYEVGAPPVTRQIGDAYDFWGGVFVGGSDIEDQYWPTAADGCTTDAGGRQVRFPITVVNGVEVSRTLYVPGDGLPGARLIAFVRNPGSAPLTTSVQLGSTITDTLNSNRGDLGSDDSTTVSADSSGNGTVDAGDDWLVTADATPPSPYGDPVLGHVPDGPGGADRIDAAVLTGDSPSNPEKLAWRWQDVTLAPGESAAFVSYEIQQDVYDTTAGQADTAAAVAAAKDVALAHRAASLGTVFAGMSAAEIKAVRNWARPKPSAAITPVAQGTNMADAKLSATGSRFSADVAACDTGSYAWDLGDGTTATGADVAHRYKPGTYTAKLTATNACGEAATTAATVTVAAVKAKVKVAGAKSVKLGTLLKKGLKLSISSDQDGAVGVKGVVAKKVAKKLRIPTTPLAGKGHARAAGKVSVKVKASKKAAKALNAAFAGGAKGVKVTLTTTVKTAYGKVTTVKRTLTIKR